MPPVTFFKCLMLVILLMFQRMQKAVGQAHGQIYSPTEVVFGISFETSRCPLWRNVGWSSGQRVEEIKDSI